MLSTRDVVIRAMRPEDVDAVCDMLNRLNVGPNHWGVPFEPDAFRQDLLEHGVVEFLIGTVGEQVVAMIHFAPTQTGEAAPSGVFSQLIVIDPQFRGTRVAEKLVRQSVQYLVNAGYDRLEATALPDSASLRLQRRAGFRQVSDAAVGDEEVVHLVNYMPMLIRYLFRAFKDERAALGLRKAVVPLTGADPLSLAALPSVAKEAVDTDQVPWHGGRAVEYALRLPGRAGHLDVLVDLDADAVAAVDGDDVAFACWPAGDRRQTTAGQATGEVVRLVNRRTEPLRAEVVASESQRVVFEGVLDPGQAWEDEIVFTPAAMGRALSSFDASVSALDGSAPRRFTVATSTEVHEAATQHRAVGGANRVEAGSTEWVLRTRALRLSVSMATGNLTAVHQPTGQALLRELWPDVGPPAPPTHHRAVRRALRLVELAVRDGVPELVVESAANVWTGRDPNIARAHPSAAALDGLVVQRRLRLVDSNLVEVVTTVRRERGEPMPGAAHGLRLFPWALVPAPAIVVPLEAGTLRAPVVDFGFPFATDGTEQFHDFDLPETPADVPAAWCAFEGGEWVAGLAWQDAADLRFGQRWMPSVLLAVPPLAVGDQAELPPYRLSGGRGDHRLVADTAFAPDKATVLPRPLPARLPVTLDVAPALADAAGRARLTGRVGVVAGRPRPGRLRTADDTVEGTAPFEVDLGVAAPDRPGVHQAEVAWHEDEGVLRWPVPVIVPSSAAVELEPARDDEGAWTLDNGWLRVAVADDGAVSGLWVDGTPLAPEFAARFHLVDPERHFLVHPAPVDVPWQAACRPWAGDGWTGVEAVGEPGERWPGLSARFVFATRPGAPVLLASATVTSAVDARPVDLAFSLTLPRADYSAMLVARPDGPVELGAESVFDGVPSDGPRVAHGREAAVLSSDGRRLALVADDAAVWAAKWHGYWQATAQRRAATGPGERTALHACLAVGEAGLDALRALPALVRSTLER